MGTNQNIFIRLDRPDGLLLERIESERIFFGITSSIKGFSLEILGIENFMDAALVSSQYLNLEIVEFVFLDSFVITFRLLFSNGFLMLIGEFVSNDG